MGIVNYRGLAMKILSEKLVPIPIVAKLLEEESRKRNLSSFEVITLEYAKKFTKIRAEAADELVQALVERGLPLDIAVQVVNTVPESESELRTILAPLSRVFSTDELREIINLLKSYKIAET
ncbi:MAG: RNA polymerase Rpb4 family protein [Thermofilaceae archaeon]